MTAVTGNALLEEQWSKQGDELSSVEVDFVMTFKAGNQ
jgi:hypothetical protein